MSHQHTEIQTFYPAYFLMHDLDEINKNQPHDKMITEKAHSQIKNVIRTNRLNDDDHRLVLNVMTGNLAWLSLEEYNKMIENGDYIES